MSPGIFLVRTPLVERPELTYGGPLRVKTASGPAYLGFASQDLARAACEHWNMRRSVHIEPWQDAVRHDAGENRPVRVVVLRDLADFEAYLKSPESFPIDARTVRLFAVS